MTPYEMEEQLKNLDVRTTAIEQKLPTLATRDDLRLTTDALQFEMAKLPTKEDLKAGLEDAKGYTLLLIETTRGEIRQIRDQMATKDDLAIIRGEMTAHRIATKRDLQRLETATKQEFQRRETATRRDIQQLQRALSKQIATLRAPGRKKR